MPDVAFRGFLAKYVSRQLETMFPSFGDEEGIGFEAIDEAIRRTDFCLAHVKGFRGGHFDHLNSGQYTTFLYFLSRSLSKVKKTNLATRLFLLNKALNGIDLFHEIEMPDVFLVGHTVCMVFAKAQYSDFCVFHQGCTVGRNKDSRPTLERGVILYPHSSVIGKCLVRENTVLSPGVHLVNCDTPGNCLVFQGKSGKPIFKETSESYLERYFSTSPPTSG